MTRSHAVPARSKAAASRPTQLAGVRAGLVRQRDFRREQLERHARRDTTSATSGALDPTCEVQGLVAVAAQRALEDIELALSRIANGQYGYCIVCDTRIPLAVLQAVPQTTMCLPCLQSTDRPGGSDDRAPEAGSRRIRRGGGMPNGDRP